MSSLVSYPAQADAASNTDPVSVTVPDEAPSTPVMHTLRTMGYNAQRIRCKSYATQHAKYDILSYDPQWICQDDVETGLYRSVVVDPETNRVLAYSPPHSMDVNRFAVKHPQTNLARYVATEAVEGTMINLFYDWRIQKWEIATKNAIGGKYCFFRTQYPVDDASVAATHSPATFLDMFLDNFNHISPWKAEDGTSVARDFDDIWWLPILDTQYTYSFVLQHPKNHIVYPVDKPKLYLVAVYEMLAGVNEAETDIHTARMVPYEEYSQYKVIREMILTGCVHYPPAILTRPTVDAYRKQHCEPERPADKMGVMIWDTVTGDRVHLENQAYLALKELRGNNPNLQYHYFSLYRMNKVREFLLAFPMYKKSFYRFYTQYHNMITKVHEGYLSYYVRKEGIPIDKNVFVHVSRIHHEIYLKSLAEGNKKVITHKVVRAYFDAKEPRELLSK
jgi:hypothetical protein